MQHNADGCMKDFEKEQVWGRLKHRKDIWCEIKLKPLINLDIYTKDWAFKVVGSVNWHDRTYQQLTVPSKEFFMATRMADRTGIPSFSNIRTSWYKRGSPAGEGEMEGPDAHRRVLKGVPTSPINHSKDCKETFNHSHQRRHYQPQACYYACNHPLHRHSRRRTDPHDRVHRAEIEAWQILSIREN